MVYTEVKQRNGKKYYYRVLSVRRGKKIGKYRIYLGVDLDENIIIEREKEADKAILKEKSEKAINKLKPKIVRVLKKYNIKRAGIFGSYARGEQKKSSDIDIIVEYPGGIGFAFFSLGDKLEKLLKKKVDVITYGGINRYMKDNILKDEVRIIG